MFRQKKVVLFPLFFFFYFFNAVHGSETLYTNSSSSVSSCALKSLSMCSDDHQIGSGRILVDKYFLFFSKFLIVAKRTPNIQ